MFNYYVYIYLNPLKEGKYSFGKHCFKFEPFYVGKGKDNRNLVHLYTTDKCNIIKQRTLDKIKRNNLKPIIIKLYENISECSAFRLERYLINMIGRRDLKLGLLTNLTNGGDGASGAIFTREKRNNMISNKQGIIKYSISGIVIEIFENITDLSIKYPQYRTNHIHRACKSNGGRKIDGYFWKYYNDESIGDLVELNDEFKHILQYDLDGNYIKTWNCSNETRDYTKSNGSAVLKCCRNNYNTTKLYKFKNNMWFFTKNNFAVKIEPYSEKNAKGSNRIELKHIRQYTMNDILIGTFSPKELKNFGFFTKTIYGCCNSKFTTSQGYKWKWA